MTALADRIEGLAGPDREVDALITVALKGGDARVVWSKGRRWYYSGGKDRIPHAVAGGNGTKWGIAFQTIRYTASMDAAMTLAGDDWQEILHTALERMYLFHAAEATPTDLARFISAAALRARAE